VFPFSKKLANHVGAIKLFICHYNPQNEDLSDKGLARGSICERSRRTRLSRIWSGSLRPQRHPDWGYGYTAALINFAFLANTVLTTDGALKAMK
jgi:hypothetical protein